MERNYLIVAADGQVRQNLAQNLRSEGVGLTLAENGSEAQRVVQTVSVDLAVIESHLPDMSAEELASRIRGIRPDCQVMTLSGFKLVRNTPELLRFGNEDYMLRGEELSALLQTNTDGGLDGGFWPWEESGNQALVEVIDVLVGLLEIEYKELSGSSHQAVQLARATAEQLAAHEEMINEVVLGTLLRDVGKVGVEAARSESEARDDERRRNNEHVEASLRLFEHIEFPYKVMPVIRHHHEHYNGTGGPDGLRGREIPMGARIVAVVDAYIAMTCGRGAECLAPDAALKELVRGAGHRFDPEVVEAFQRVIDTRFAGRKTRTKPSVLVVEPDKQFRRLLRMRLANEGMKVYETASVGKAMGILLKHRPDLVLASLPIDPAEEFQLLQEMQQDENLCKTPIAFLANRTDRLTKLRALRMGVDDFINKGDDVEELVARVESIMLRQSLRSDTSRPARRGITGSLADLDLPDMIQTLAIGMKTACLKIHSGERVGEIWIENGTPRHSIAGETEGEQAFYQMLRWSEGEFSIEHGVKTKEKTLNQDAMYLLMEGLRLMDEAGREKSQAV